MAEFICISVPHFIGELVQNSPEIDQIKASKFADSIGAPWIDVEPDFSGGVTPVLAVNRALAAAIAAHPDRIPLIFAGDCVSGLGAMKGLERHHPAVIWFDAHGDFNTPHTTPSGFLGGMPLAMLVGRGDLSLLHGLALDPTPEEDVILTDARDLDPMESIALRGSGVTHLIAVERLLTAALPLGPVYIHLDTDVIDPLEMPGMGYPAPDGPSAREVQAALARVVRETQPVGLLLTLWDATRTEDPRPLKNTLMLAHTFVDELRVKAG